MTYAEKLKDPRWQKKRLEVLEAHGWKCTMCDDNKKTLHVHHRGYKKGFEPWEYELEELDCLCVDCHEDATVMQDEINSSLALLDESQKENLLGYIAALIIDQRWQGIDELECPPIRLRSFEWTVGFADYWGVNADDLIQMAVAE